MRGKRTQHLFTAVGECMIFLTISHALLPSLMVVTDNRGGGASARHRRVDSTSNSRARHGGGQ
jgi:hypothetical protein